MDTPHTEFRPSKAEGLLSSQFSFPELPLPTRAAPPEQTGDGCLMPAVLLGLGQTGMELLQQFRRSVGEAFGAFERVPCLKILYVDTDPETLHASTATSAAALAPGEVVPARLNRASHYLKPRRNGSTLVEGWFDPQLLYRIPRNPATVGLRQLGRLAYLDHYRAIETKLREALEAVAKPDALGTADRGTRLGLRTNRPRVYVVANLAGGTGGGMFLDAAYTARLKLRQLGYADPDVVGLFFVPAADKANAKGPALANAYAGLRELYHYGLTDSTFGAGYDEVGGTVRDAGALFARVMIVPLPPGPRGAAGGSFADPIRQAADVLRRELLTPLGRTCDAAREQIDRPEGEVTVSAFGQTAFTWPRQAILAQTARWLGATVLSRWVTSSPDKLRGYVSSWLETRWRLEKLHPDPLLATLRQHADATLGKPAGEFFAAEAKQFQARGWFAREPDPLKVRAALQKVQHLVGMPDERSVQRMAGQLEADMDRAAQHLLAEVGPKFARLATTLLEHPDYRVVGAEEAVKVIQENLDKIVVDFNDRSVTVGQQAIDAFYVAHRYCDPELGARKPAAAEVGEALKAYPLARIESLVLRALARVYASVSTQLSDQLREIRFCRQRLEEMMSRLRQPRTDVLPPGELTLLPAGLDSMERAVRALQESIGAEELRGFDKLLQTHIETEFTALFNVCLSSPNMFGTLQGFVESQARSYLAERFGTFSVADMFFARYPDYPAAGGVLRRLYEQALPAVKVPPSVRGEEVAVFAVPPGAEGEPIMRVASHALADTGAVTADTTDEVFVYREFPRLPLTALPQLGPLAEDAYRVALDGPNGSPHCRTDVTAWSDVEVG